LIIDDRQLMIVPAPTSGLFIKSSISIINPYMLIASVGQASMHTPQSTQPSALTTALPSTMLIALLGHSLIQDSQPVHLSAFTSAGIQQPFQ
jgi:hypothetical protein